MFAVPAKSATSLPGIASGNHRHIVIAILHTTSASVAFLMHSFGRFSWRRLEDGKACPWHPQVALSVFVISVPLGWAELSGPMYGTSCTVWFDACCPVLVRQCIEGASAHPLLVVLGAMSRWLLNHDDFRGNETYNYIMLFAESTLAEPGCLVTVE